jgi:hypothetical protein
MGLEKVVDSEAVLTRELAHATRTVECSASTRTPRIFDKSITNPSSTLARKIPRNHCWRRHCKVVKIPRNRFLGCIST